MPKLTNDNTEKLQKVLAREGVASRREAERWITEGRITVNGQIATLGDRVDTDAHIFVDGKPLRTNVVNQRILMYYKPEGEVCTRDDPQGRPTVFDTLPRLTVGRWIAVGRLDINTTGLLLFTNDGELANQLMHPSANLAREYRVRVLGDITPEIMRRLTTGVELEDGMAAFKRMHIVRGSSANKWCEVVLMEGRNREVKRLFESQGLTVNKLKRTRFGKHKLPISMKPGQFYELTPDA